MSALLHLAQAYPLYAIAYVFLLIGCFSDWRERRTTKEQHMNRMNRVAYGNLLESMDVCDATRSHEMVPSQRIRMNVRSGRYARRFYGSFAALGAALVAIALFAH